MRLRVNGSGVTDEPGETSGLRGAMSGRET